MIDCYDPNLSEGTHTIRVTIQQWGYRGHIDVEVGGNCKGLAILEGIAGTIMFADQVASDCAFEVVEITDDDDEQVFWRAKLANSKGEILETDGDEDDLGSAIVAMEIIRFVKDGDA